MSKWLVASVLLLAACGGGSNGPNFIPDASEAGCGLGTWTLTATAGAGTCAQPGSTNEIEIEATYMTGGGVSLVVVGDPSITITGTTTDEDDGCRLQAQLMFQATGPNGENGTASDTISVTEVDGAVSGFGASSVSGGFSCNQASSYAGTYTP
jgi:hypothetical protein